MDGEGLADGYYVSTASPEPTSLRGRDGKLDKRWDGKGWEEGESREHVSRNMRRDARRGRRDALTSSHADRR